MAPLGQLDRKALLVGQPAQLAPKARLDQKVPQGRRERLDQAPLAQPALLVQLAQRAQLARQVPQD
jgi:hypothetical protein